MKHPYYYFRLHRYEGQLLYLLVAKLGITCLIASCLLSAAAAYLFDRLGWFDYLSWLACQLTYFDLVTSPHAYPYAFMLQASIVALFIPRLWASGWRMVASAFYKRKYKSTAESVLLSDILKDSPIGIMLLSSISHEKHMLMISMEDRKVYVGHVHEIGDPNEASGPHESFMLLPSYSGYRDKDSMEVTLNTFYPQETSSFVVLRQENIVSITRFNADNWDNFKKDKAKREKADKKPLKRLLDLLI
ncbi:hypothetical protein ACI2KR_08095 [Pseudomonas luteola]